jgi:vacuolar-type H+-ATPase subunit I/STV1
VRTLTWAAVITTLTIGLLGGILILSIIGAVLYIFGSILFVLL